eukprot:6260356-Amphidinium_carterae.1
MNLPKSVSSGALFVRLREISGSWWVRHCVCVLNSGPGSGVRPLPEAELEVVESAKKTEFPAAPFVIGPHQRVVN